MTNHEISVDTTEFSRCYFFVIKREKELQTIHELLRKYPIVGIVGARQVGKTTLARMIISKKRGSYSYFDLENPEDSSRLSDPMLALKELKELVSCQLNIIGFMT